MAQPKILEADLLIPTLRYLKNLGPQASRQLIDLLTDLFQPADVNAVIVANGEPAFNQIVRNMVSNRFSGNNIINSGYATYDEQTHLVSITQSGLTFLAAHDT